MAQHDDIAALAQSIDKGLTLKWSAKNVDRYDDACE